MIGDDVSSEVRLLTRVPTPSPSCPAARQQELAAGVKRTKRNTKEHGSRPLDSVRAAYPPGESPHVDEPVAALSPVLAGRDSPPGTARNVGLQKLRQHHGLCTSNAIPQTAKPCIHLVPFAGVGCSLDTDVALLTGPPARNSQLAVVAQEGTTWVARSARGCGLRFSSCPRRDHHTSAHDGPPATSFLA